MADSEDVFEAGKKKQKARRNKHSHEQRARKRKQAAIDKRAAKALSSTPVADEGKSCLSTSIISAAQRLD